MLYDSTLDEHIIEVAFSEEKLFYKELKAGVERKRRKTVSHDTFSLHLKRLIRGGILSRKDLGFRGKPSVLYQLEAKARVKQHLKMLVGPNKEKRIKLYQAILFYESEPNKVQVPDSDLEHFLRQFGKSLGDLKVLHRKELPGEPNSNDPLAILTYYDVSADIVFWKCDSRSAIPYFDGYFYKTLGFSKKAIVNHRKFLYHPFDFPPEEIDEAFDALEKQRLIRAVSDFGGEKHFVIADGRLRELLKELWSIIEDEWVRYYITWISVRSPTAKERKWLMQWYGEKNATETLDQTAMERAAYLKDVRERRAAGDKIENWRKKLVEKMESRTNAKIDMLRKQYDSILETYSFLHDVLSVVCPRIIAL